MVATAAASSLFASLDKDGDGKVSAADLRGCMAAALGDDDKAEAVLAWVDADGDGLLDRDDFLSLLAVHDHDEEEEEESSSRYRCLREAFRMYAEEVPEADDDPEQQRITPASLQRMLSRLLGSSPHPELEECRAMICRFDLDGDGVLSFHEFRVMMHDGLLIM